MKYLFCILALSFLYEIATSSNVVDLKDVKVDVVKTVVVGNNGATDFKSIQAAIDSIPSGNNNWIKIHLKDGIYNEKIVIPREKQKIVLHGDSASRVVIQYNDAGRSDSSGPLIVNAEYFVAISITFKNTYNTMTPIVRYKDLKVAPAIILMADKAWFYGCGFISIQDTIADMLGRHYFQNCYIEGAIDFIWGRGQSIYQKCVIHVRGVTSKQVVQDGEMLPGFITAQGRESEQDKSGFVFKNCLINGDGNAHLGRAYRAYSRVIFYKTYMLNVIVPQGWDAWSYKGHEDKFVFAEVQCTGEGADKKGRIGWEKDLSPKYVEFFIQPQTFINEDGWMAALPSSLISLYLPSSTYYES